MKNSYNDAINLLTSVGKFHVSLGLERISKILELLGNPQDKLECIHVAGTNGKGSVCAILASILKCAGKKVGLYTSPHIFKYNERIQISGRCITDEDFAKYVFEISNLADKNNVDLTEFEILTAVMFKYFADNGVEVVVLETGLGGRFDATNVIKKNLCSVITHIDYDHTERLGNTLDKIAYEKAGIIKAGCPCIVMEGREVYRDVADEKCSMLVMICPMADVSDLALKGIHQQENLSLALAAIETVFPEITKDVIDAGLKSVKHICRFQYVPENNLIIDGAHNPNGISALVQSLDFYYPNEKRRYILGCLKNKDYEKMLGLLFEEYIGQTEYNLPEVYFYKFNHQNACDVKVLKESCSIPSQELSEDINIDFNDGRLNIICGSLYMIAELVERFKINVQ